MLVVFRTFPTLIHRLLLSVMVFVFTFVNCCRMCFLQGMREDGSHTRFWETDRTRSTFSRPCLPNGEIDMTEGWPVCLEDIQCDVTPPWIPTHPDYGVITGGAPGVPRQVPPNHLGHLGHRVLRDVGADDGQAATHSLIYPEE